MNEKPVPVNIGERVSSIPPAASSIAARGVQSLEMAVPEFHRTFMRTLGVNGDDSSVMSMPTMAQRLAQRPVTVKRGFERGDVAMDTERGVRVTIIKCAVANTKSGTPIHRVVSKKTGDSWKVSEKKLKHLDE